MRYGSPPRSARVQVGRRPDLRPAPLVFCTFAGLLAACATRLAVGPIAPSPTATLDAASAAGRGQSLFTGTVARCSTCHALSADTVIVGPSLAGVATRAADRVAGLSAEEYLYQSILDPDAFKAPGFENTAMDPTLARTLTIEQVDDLVAYLLTLK